ncbi:MAG: hypothetical protein Q8O35_02050, partial [Humidesulfovibrio sp.]|uniref:hypothetical protein n=1 Tax=Humidesulfovibrio sp. TaxID=2910988 RepID=UPI0027333E4F
MSTKKSPAAITFAEAFKQLADEGREAKIRYDQACVRTTSTPRKPPHEERERQTQEAMSMPEPKKPRRTSLLDKIKAHNPIGEERQQQSREILDRMVPGGNPHSESHSELHGVNLTPGSSPSPPKRLDRLREIYQSHEGYEGNYENWKN